MTYKDHGIGDPLEVPVTTAHLRAAIAMTGLRRKVIAHEVGVSLSALKVTLSGKTLDRTIAGERTKSHRRIVEFLESHGILFTDAGVMQVSRLKSVDADECFDLAVRISKDYINGNKEDARIGFRLVPSNAVPIVTLTMRKIILQLNEDDQSFEKFLLSL